MDRLTEFLMDPGSQAWLGALVGIVGWEIGFLAVRTLRRYARTTETPLDDRLADALESWLRRLFGRR